MPVKRGKRRLGVLAAKRSRRARVMLPGLIRFRKHLSAGKKAHILNFIIEVG